jgi:hypothetical protein
MTTRSVTLKFLAVAAVSLICLGMFPAFAQEMGDPVTIEKDRILIPGTNISETDQAEGLCERKSWQAARHPE